MLSVELIEEFRIKHVFTRKFNQDPLEDSFAQIRMAGGHKSNPSAYNFNRCVGKLMA